MARHYGQVRSDIWRNPDFRRLTSSAQRVYLMLITQADITSAGTLAITIRRWAAYSPDTPSHALSDALSELASARFIVVDEATEELLVRKFVKWDGGHTNEKRREAITAAANALESPLIRAAMAIELDKLAVPHALSDRASDTPRVVVTLGEYLPQPTTHNPETTTREPAPTKAVARTRGSRLPLGWRPSEAVVAWARAAGYDDGWARQVTEDFCDYWHAKAGSGAVKLDWDLTWRRWVKKAADDRRGGAGKKSTTDQRVSDGLALAAKYQAEGR